MTSTFQDIVTALVAQYDGPEFVVPISSLASGSSSTSLVLTQGPGSGLRDWGYSSSSANKYDGLHAWITVATSTLSSDSDSGTSTAVGTTSLTDSGKSWTVNHWVGAVVVSGTKSMTVTSNTATVLSGIAWSGGSNPSTGTYTLTLAAAGPDGEYGGQVTRGGNSAGTLTISPGFSADPNSANSGAYLLMTKDSPYDYLDAIQSIQEHQYMDRFLPWGLNADADMESSGVTSWAATSGNATITKSTTDQMVGARTLKVVTTVVSEGALNTVLNVRPGTTVLVSALVRVGSTSPPTILGSLAVSLYDVTNSTSLHSVTVSSPEWTEVRFQYSVPSTCNQVRLRLLSATAATTAYVNWALIQPQGIEALDMSKSATLSTLNPSDILGFYYLPQGYTGSTGETYEGFTQSLVPWPSLETSRDYSALNPFWPGVQSPGSSPLFIKFRGCETPFTGINATTSEVSHLPSGLLVAGAMMEMHRGKNDKEMIRWGKAYGAHLNAIGLGRKKVIWRPQRRVGAL